MPPITSTLQKYDLDMLNRVARTWDVEITQRDVKSARVDLAAHMAQKDGFEALFEGLAEPARNAWLSLARRGGRQTWSEFSRLNGDIRSLGVAARERENPDLNPVSIAETLWYAGLIGRSFFGGAGDTVEYAYIPDELLARYSKPDEPQIKPLLRPAVNQSPRYVIRADLALPDQLTDLLAANRMHRELPDEVFNGWGIPRRFMHALLRSANLTDAEGQPNLEALKAFFAAGRGAVLHDLFKAWLSSKEINELRMLPDLVCEGNWSNDPLAPRRLLVDTLSALEPGTWWSISSLIAYVKETNPDFQRTAGEYDAWFIREKHSGSFLSGFESWDLVEGALLHYLLTGPLHWFGLLNLASGGKDGEFTAFQLVPETFTMLRGDPPDTLSGENKPIKIMDNRVLVIPAGASRTLRYQVARMGELIHFTRSESRYMLTAASLEGAAGQGMHIQQLLQLIEKEQPGTVPEGLRHLAERWTRNGVEAGFERVTVLRFMDKPACAEFIKAAGARFILEQLTPQVIVIQSSQQEGVRRLLAELGILAENEADV